MSCKISSNHHNYLLDSSKPIKSKTSSFSYNCRIRKLAQESTTLLTLSQKNTYPIDIDSQWEKVEAFAKKLKKDHYVFAHSSSYVDSLITGLQTHLDPSTLFPAFSSRWATQRKFRSHFTPINYENTEKYFHSDLRKDIDRRIKNDHFPNNAQMLSCDAYLKNRQSAESAYFYFMNNQNFNNLNFPQFLKDYIKNPSICDFANTTYLKLRSLFNSTIIGQGRIYLIAIPKETLENEKTCYVWRSHPLGVVCSCYNTETHPQSHKGFIEVLKKHQDDVDEKICKAYSQYRILAPNLDRDPTKQIFVLDSLTPCQETVFQVHFWDFATLLKQCQRLESISENTSKELLLSILLRTRFNIDDSTFPISEKSYHKKGLTSYEKGLQEILKSKKAILKKHRKYLIEHLPKSLLAGFRKARIHIF